MYYGLNGTARSTRVTQICGEYERPFVCVHVAEPRVLNAALNAFEIISSKARVTRGREAMPWIP